MESFVIAERTKMKISLFGQDFEILKPTVADSRGHLERLNADEDVMSKQAIWIDFLVQRGLPREILDSLETSQFWDLVGFISGAKKN